MNRENVIGLLPCGGQAKRIGPLPCSKEILPVGLRHTSDGLVRPKVVSHYLLEKMCEAGIRRAFFILRSGKWDIPEYYGSGDTIGMDLAYLIMSRSHGPPYTLDEAYPFVRGARVAFGFPDILFEPGDAFARALARLESTTADIVLGLYRAHDNPISDMVDVDRTGRVRELVLSPKKTKLQLGWVFAVWTPTFTDFLHEYLTEPRTAREGSNASLPVELTMGHVIQAAIEKGIGTQSLTFRRSTYLDVGTGDGLQRLATRKSPLGRDTCSPAKRK
jgi:glucose-1-phosphate thymidylyltransferase